MAKASSFHGSTTTTDTPSISSEEAALIKAEIPRNLRAIARHFITEVKKQFDPLALRRESFWTTNPADKFAFIANEYAQQGNRDGLYSDTRIQNMFNHPAFFPADKWQTIPYADRNHIISVGLRATGNVILHRSKADRYPAYRSELRGERKSSKRSAHDPSKRKSNATTLKVSGAPSGWIPSIKRSAQHALLATTPEESPAGLSHHVELPRMEAKKFDLQVLNTPVRAIPGLDRLADFLEARQSKVVTLLDLANFPASVLHRTQRQTGLTINKFNLLLHVVQDDHGASFGKALSLIFAPLSKIPGGLRLSRKAVNSLMNIAVAPSAITDGTATTLPGFPTLHIDNGWRLLRHYKHAEMNILSDKDIQIVSNQFRQAGFGDV